MSQTEAVTLSGFFKAKAENPIHFAAIEVTKQCNMQCGHCYAGSSPVHALRGKMTDEDVIDTIRKLIGYGVRSVQFIGGEPLLHPSIERFVRVSFECGVNAVEIYSNLSVLTPEQLEMCTAYDVMIASSYYSHIESVHKAITDSQVSLACIDENIRKVVAAGLPIRIGVIRTEKNTAHIDTVVAHVKSLGVEDVTIDDVRHLGRQKSTLNGDKNHTLCGRCGKNQMAITTSGDVFPCVLSRVVTGNILEDDMHTLHANINAFRAEKIRSMSPNDIVFVESYDTCHSEGSIEDRGTCPPQQRCNPNIAPCKPRQTCQPNH